MVEQTRARAGELFREIAISVLIGCLLDIHLCSLHFRFRKRIVHFHFKLIWDFIGVSGCHSLTNSQKKVQLKFVVYFWLLTKVYLNKIDIKKWFLYVLHTHDSGLSLQQSLMSKWIEFCWSQLWRKIRPFYVHFWMQRCLNLSVLLLAKNARDENTCWYFIG